MMKHLPHLRTSRLLAAAMLFVLLTGAVQAQHFDLKFRTPIVTDRAWYQTVFEQADRKVLIVGSQEYAGRTSVGELVRYSRSGILDRSFKPDYDGWADQIADFSKGTLLVLDDDDDELVQITKRGEIVNWSNISDVEDFVVLPDFSVIFYSDGYIYRATSDLEYDDSFAGGQGWIEVDGNINDLQLQGDKVIVAGSFSGLGNGEIGWTDINSIARISQNGWVDATFNPGDGPSDGIGSVTIQKDGKILLGNSYINQFNNEYFNGSLIRLNADGSLDTGFFGHWYSWLGNVHVTSSGKIIAAATSYGAVFGMNSNGEWNDDFHTVYFDDTDEDFNAYFLRGDEFITLNGFFNDTDGGIHRFNGNGQKFKGFDLDLSEAGSITTVMPQGDNMIIGGNFTKVNGVVSPSIARLTKAGAVDPTFKPSWNYYNVNDIQAFSDGSLMAKTDGYGFIHLNANGTWNGYMNFAGSNNFYSWGAIKAKIVADDKVVVDFYYPSGIGRRNMDGSIDNTFTEAVSNMYDSYWNDFDVQTDGKILFAGYFNQINGNSVSKGIVRLNADGTIDNSFNAGSGVDYYYVKQVTALTDGGVLLQGYFYSVQGQSVYNVAKLSSNGDFDGTFYTNYSSQNFYPWYYDYETVPFRDGFVKYSYRQYPYYQDKQWFVNNNGWVEESAIFPESMYAYSGKIVPLNDNTILYVGDAVLNGQWKNSVWKIVVPDAEPVVLSAGRVAQGTMSTFPNPTVSHISFDTNAPVRFSIYGFDGSLKIDGKVSSSEEKIDVSNLQPGRYVVKVNVNGKTLTQHLIKN